MSLAEVNQVLSLNRVRSASRSLTFLRQVVEFLAVFLVFPQNSVLRRRILVWNALLSELWSRPFSLLVRNAFLSGLWSRLLLVDTFLLVLHVVEVFVVVLTVFLRFRAPHKIFQFLLETLMKGFSHFSLVNKSAKVGARSRSELAAHSSSSTLGAYGVVSSLEEPVQEDKKEKHQVSPMPDSIECVQLSDDKGRPHFWNRRARRCGSRRRASESSGSARRVLEGRSGTGTRVPVSVHMTFLLCLLSEACRGEGLGIPSPHLGCHTGPGVMAGPVGSLLYMAVPVPGVLPIFVVLPYSAPMVRQWLHVPSVCRGLGISRVFCLKVDLGS